MNRDKALTTAGELVNGDRARDYGDARTNFQRIADLITPVLAAKLVPGARIDPHEVGLILAMLKVARLIQSPGHEDSWCDLLGYAALGAEIATSGAGGAGEDPDALETGSEAGESVLRVGARVRVKQGVRRGAFVSMRAGKQGTIVQPGDSTDWLVLLDGDIGTSGLYEDEIEVIG